MNPHQRSERHPGPDRAEEGIPQVRIREATIADAALIMRMIVELAEFDRELDQVVTTEADIVRDGFGTNPQFRALIGEWRGEPVGFAIFFNYYSTWKGAGLYLEDLFVRPDFRGRGVGSALLARVAHVAEQEARRFIRWTVLDWNQPAINLYKSLGVHFLEEWRIVVLADKSLRKLAQKNP